MSQTTAFYNTDQAGTIILYWMIAPPSGTGMGYDGDQQAFSIDSSGTYCTALFYKGATYQIQCGNGPVVTFVVPLSAGPTTPLPNLLGLSS